METAKLRELFIDFFRSKDHYIEPSASLVPPPDDKSLLFINAGMAPLKPFFLGLTEPPSARIASCQRCLRTTDIDEVGRTPRHLTWFEMLGNFSFGDYFKEEIIIWSWEFVREWLKIPAEKLRISIHETDDEAGKIWQKEVGIKPDWIYRLGDEENFWFMAETGPCGPDSEIFYDLGEELGPDSTPETGGDRWVELWNLVFTQFDRQADGTLKPLPKKNVDTGMGLERTAMALQGKLSVFEADCFAPIIDAFKDTLPSGILVKEKHLQGGVNSLYVVSDHIRAGAMLIADGVYPSKEGRGYVLRRLLRRALVHMRRLGFYEGGLLRGFDPVYDLLHGDYPNLVNRRADIELIIKNEEDSFLRTLNAGMARFESQVASLEGNVIPKELAFEMFDTYGVPLDVTVEMAGARGMSVDEKGFHSALENARIRSREVTEDLLDADQELRHAIRTTEKTEYTGYDENMTVARLVEYDQEHGFVVLDRTPFYAEMGGQCADTGTLRFKDGEFTVIDTQYVGETVVHKIDPEKTTGDPSRLKPGDPIEACVDADCRRGIRRAHTATHLLHAALRNVLGEHVQQAGSLVEPDRLRFDFSHYQPLTKEQIRKIEDRANEQVFAEHPVHDAVVPIEKARKAGAMALFGEKYGEEVRMVWVGGRETEPVPGQVESTELCGGTHVDNTGVIGLIKITSEESVASGVRRIEALTGRRAYEETQRKNEILKTVSDNLRLPVRDLERGSIKLSEQAKKLEREKKELEHRLASGQTGVQAEEIKVGKVTAFILPTQSLPPDAVGKMLDERVTTDGPVVAFAVTDYEGKGAVLIRCSDAAVEGGLKAGDLVRKVAPAMNGRGGGKPSFARGGVDPSKYDAGKAAFIEAMKQAT